MASLREQTEGLTRELGARYGDDVAVEYVDIYSPEMFQRHMEALRLITTRRVALPLISIAGKPRFVGGISTPMICEALERLGVRPANGA
ncbi:MAG: hypothetical protein ACYC1C_09725 [Chloroflexota bacterium]